MSFGVGGSPKDSLLGAIAIFMFTTLPYLVWRLTAKSIAFTASA
jgi:hypothetical protein